MEQNETKRGAQRPFLTSENTRFSAVNTGRERSYINVNLLLDATSAPRSSVKLFYFFRHITSRRSSTYAGRALRMLFVSLRERPAARPVREVVSPRLPERVIHRRSLVIDVQRSLRCFRRVTVRPLCHLPAEPFVLDANNRQVGVFDQRLEQSIERADVGD